MSQRNQSESVQAIVLFFFLFVADTSVAFAPPYPSLMSRQHCQPSPASLFRPPVYHPQHEISGGRNSVSTVTHALPPSTWWVLSHVAAGAAGAPIVASATRTGGWYRKIDLPSWNPPDWLFGPVWTTLYACMGFAVSRIYHSSNVSAVGAATKNTALLLWAVHFTLNILWAPVFFGLQRFRLGFALSVLMVVTLVMAIPMFYAINATSAYLLLPYLAWITFATFLNKAICKLNPTERGYNNAMFQAQLAELQDKAAKYADAM
jgi:benzodiazapine receptor